MAIRIKTGVSSESLSGGGVASHDMCTPTALIRRFFPVLLGSLLLCLTTTALAGNKPDPARPVAHSPVTGGCVQLAAADPVIPVTQPLPTAQVKAQAPLQQEGLLQPATADDLTLMIRALQPATTRDHGWALGLATAEGEFNTERFGVVLNDVLAQLALLQSQSVLEQLQRSGNATPQDSRWMSMTYEVMQSCVRERYRQWGGEAAYRQAMNLVANNRATLEALLAAYLQRGSRGAAGLPR